MYFLLTLLILLGSKCLGEVGVEGRQFGRCELVRKLRNDYRYLPQFSKTLLPSWICLIEHESGRDTSKRSKAGPLSNSYGLFQIKSNRWCGETRKQGLCNKKCSDFLDDNIDDDVACAIKIFDTEGFKFWEGWRRYCKLPQNLPQLAQVCPNYLNYEYISVTKNLKVMTIMEVMKITK